MNEPIENIGNWKYMIKNWENLLSTQRKVIIRSLRLGIPDKYRGKVWALLTGAEKAKSEASFQYKDMSKESSSSIRQIDVDIYRTYPSWSLQTPDRLIKALRRVLNAYAWTDSEIGYTQGMNFIVALFLLYQDEETAFWSFYSLMHLSSLPHRLFFMNNFPKLHLLVKLIDMMIEEKFPKVSAALKGRKFDSTLFGPQWFMICFLAAGFDLEMTSFIFDEFLAFGVAPLVSFGLAIIQIHQDIIETEGFEHFLKYLTNPGSSPRMKSIVKVNIAWNDNWMTSKQYESRMRIIKGKYRNNEEQNDS